MLNGVIQAGSPAPDFALANQEERQTRLGDLRGSWVVLWWFPKASTGG
jgi:thioredoxin-dependent peroxiredoxin